MELIYCTSNIHTERTYKHDPRHYLWLNTYRGTCWHKYFYKTAKCVTIHSYDERMLSDSYLLPDFLSSPFSSILLLSSLSSSFPLCPPLLFPPVCFVSRIRSFVYATREPPKMAQFDWFYLGIFGNIPWLRSQTFHRKILINKQITNK